MAGALVWLLLAVAVHLRYGLDAFLIVGWGVSVLVCLVFVVTPLLRTAPRERDAAPAVQRNSMLA